MRILGTCFTAAAFIIVLSWVATHTRIHAEILKLNAPLQVFADEEQIRDIGNSGNVLNIQELGMSFRLVAHAGGGVLSFVNSNSLEALQTSASLGYKYIELDLITTTDGYIVLNHSWESMANRVPGAANIQLSHKEFMQLEIFQRFTPTDLPMLIEFLGQHPSITIITDTKATDYAALYEIASNFADYTRRFLPQVYSFEDIERVKSLGFPRVLVTLYMMPLQLSTNPAEIGRLVRLHTGIYGIVFPESFATGEYISALLNALGEYADLPLFVHTVDDKERALELFNKGIYAIFTGELAPYPHYPFIKNVSAASLQLHKTSLEQQLSGFTYTLLAYYLGSPFGVEGGLPFLVGTQQRMSAPFEINGLLYLPLRRTAEHLGGYGYSWHPDISAVSFYAPNGAKHYFSRESSGIILYHDAFFADISTLEYIFPQAMFARFGNVVLVSNADAPSEEQARLVRELLLTSP